MFTLRKPSEARVIEYLLAQRQESFSYDDVGATRTATQPGASFVAPAGFVVDHERVLLGHGGEVFARAVEAVRGWKMFPREFTELFWPDAPLEAGAAVAILVRMPLCGWSLNPCKIVYVIDQTDAPQPAGVMRFGFANGTLADHLECGEERFCVEWDRQTNEVVYDLLAFSRPRHALARIGQPLVRRYQAHFRRLSCQAMQQVVGGHAPHVITKAGRTQS